MKPQRCRSGGVFRGSSPATGFCPIRITSRSHPLAAENKTPRLSSLLQKAVQLAPQSAQAHYYLGRVLEDSVPRDKSDHETTAQAIEELGTAVRLQPNFAEAHTQLGLLQQRIGDGHAAVESFRRAVEIKPDDPDAQNNLGLALIQVGDASSSIPAFEAALRLRPEDTGYRTNLGTAYLQKSDFDAAITQFQTALQSALDDATLHYDLGLALKLKDRLPEGSARRSSWQTRASEV